MKPETITALQSELERRGVSAIDDDVWKVVEASDDDLDIQDARALATFAEKLIDGKPNLFQQRDWGTLNPADFAEQERELKNRLRRPESPEANLFRDLDCALLSVEQESALRRHLSNRSSKYDRSILRAALASQRQLLGGDAA